MGRPPAPPGPQDQPGRPPGPPGRSGRAASKPEPRPGRRSSFDPTPVVVLLVTAGLVVLSQVASRDFPLGVILLGALLGTGTGLMAVGLVLTYRATRVINFAYGTMGTLAAGIAVGLHMGDPDLPWGVAAPAGVVLGVIIGGLVERIVVRRFAKAPRLVLTVATIGLAQLLGGMAFFIPTWFGTPTSVPGFDSGLENEISIFGSQVDLSFRVGPQDFNGNDLLWLPIVPLVLAALTWFLLRTEAGIALRGMAQNMERARLLGIPVNLLSLLLWSVVGGFSALVAVLRAPSLGVPFDAVAGPLLLLPALAAAVMSGMDSLWKAFMAGVGLGVMDSLLRWNFRDDVDARWVVFLGVIILALLARRKTTSRAVAADESSWSTTGVSRRLPAALSKLPAVQFARWVIALAIAVGVVALPLYGTVVHVQRATFALTFCIAALALVVLTGWGGVVSLGQFALASAGGLVAANLMAESDVHFALALPAAGLVGGLVALVVGLPALRVSGQYLAVTTMALAVAAEMYFLNPAYNAGWFPDQIDRPELLGRRTLELDTPLAHLGPYHLDDRHWLYFVALGLVGIVALLTANLRRARAGRTIAATRDNERAAAAVGIFSVETRLAAFVVSGVFAGLAGAMYVTTLQNIDFRTFETADSLLLFSMVIIGGVSSIRGAISGVALIYWLGYLFPRYQLIISGVGLLLILMVMPGGLGQAFETVRNRYAMFFARRAGIQVVEELETIEDEGVAAPPPSIQGESPPSGMWAPPAGPGQPQPIQPVPAAPGAPGAPPPAGQPAPTGPALLTCDGVEASYGSLQVLFGISSEVGSGEMQAILGTNGAGKSTLLKSVAGLLPPDRGRVRFDGKDITGKPAERIARMGLSLMPGGKGIFPTLSVAENMRLAGWMSRKHRAQGKAAQEEALQLFPILRQRWQQLAGDLSGGEQQQLSLAMAFVTRPKLLCIDELSLGLAPTIVGQLVDKVREIHAAGTTVVVVEQSVNVALLLCERAVFLEKGQVRFRGQTERLLDHPEVLRAVFLGDADEVSAQRNARPAEKVTLAAGPGGHTTVITAAAPTRRELRGVPLECYGLTKRFGGITAVNAVDLVVAPGTIVGLIGHNGAGKTTLFDVMTGFLPADGGRVLLGGKDITDRPPYKRALAKLGRSFQEARLYPSLTVPDTLAVAMERHVRNRDPIAAAVRLQPAVDSEKAIYKRVDELMELLGLEPFRERLTGELSTGSRRIVELGCLLAHDPVVILLDEPSAGIAQREAEALGPLLRRVQSQTGCSMVVIEHDMAMLSGLCDELVALEQGTVIARGSPAEVLAEPQVVASYLGTDEQVVQRSGERVR